MDRRGIDEAAAAVFDRMPPMTSIEEADYAGESRAFQMFEAPLVGVGAADDPLFARLKDRDVVGPWHRSPEEWLEGARSVVSLFFPLTERGRASNRAQGDPSLEWLYCRIEGQEYLQRYIAALAEELERAGARAVAPVLDPRFAAYKGAVPEGETEPQYGSAWSERHTAYICGLGTFGLSKGIITRRGMAGRFVSLISDLDVMPDERPYTGLYDYCIECGACIERCPVRAISADAGKRHPPCFAWLQNVTKRYPPRYGCGKCQTSVPCEHGIPARVGA